MQLGRARHQEVSGLQAEMFLKAWKRDGFSAGGYLRQSEIFDRVVRPQLQSAAVSGRVAYVLVDALRWELAGELAGVLSADFTVQTTLALGTAPSVTEVGMAALLPSASSGLRISGDKAKLNRLVRSRKRTYGNCWSWRWRGGDE